MPSCERPQLYSFETGFLTLLFSFSLFFFLFSPAELPHTDSLYPDTFEKYFQIEGRPGDDFRSEHPESFQTDSLRAQVICLFFFYSAIFEAPCNEAAQDARVISNNWLTAECNPI